MQTAIHTRNAFLLIGGYRSLGRNLTPRIRVDVRQRDKGKCQKCGKPGIEVDHVNGNSDELDNLQLLCLDCHHSKTAQNMVPANKNERRSLLLLVETRVLPLVPQLLADDEIRWATEWRALEAARKHRFLEKLRQAGLAIRRNDSHATRVLAYLDATPVHNTATAEPIDLDGKVFLGQILRRGMQ